MEILPFNEHNILCYVTYFRSTEKNKNSVTLHSDVKQCISILFQIILKSANVKGELSQAYLYIHIDTCVPGNVIIPVELKCNMNL